MKKLLYLCASLLCLALAAGAILLCGEPIIQWYLGLFSTF